MANIPYILTEQSLTVVLNGKSMTMESTNPKFEDAKVALTEENWEELESCFDLSSAVVNFTDGNIKVDEGIVTYKDETVHNHVVDRILNFMSNGLPYKPLVKFLEKLMENPSRRAIEELYSFLEHKSMPLTPDGNFLAYKGVKEDFSDWYSGQFSNQVGQELSMARNKVCDNANNGCSYGFHAGSLEYAKGYGNGGNLMVVEINPADVVSVPNDCDCQKLRTCKYKVAALFERKLEEPLCDEYGDYEDYDEDESEDESWEDGVIEESGNVIQVDTDRAFKQGYEAALKKIKDTFGNADSDSQN